MVRRPPGVNRLLTVGRTRTSLSAMHRDQDTAAPASAVLRGPADAVAAVPHLLGFAPNESLVAIWIRDGAVVLTQRLDIPPDASAAAAGQHLVATAAHAEPESLLLVISSKALPAPAGGLAHDALAKGIVDAAEHAGIAVLDALLTDDSRYWSYRCSGSCCPPEGRPITAGDRARVEAAFAGPTPRMGREELVQAWAPDVAVAAEVEPVIEEWESDLRADLDRAAADARRAVRESWRDAQIAAIETILGTATGTLAASDAARLLVGLADVRVRDTIVWQLGQAEVPRSAVDVLGSALRAAAPGYTAPVATVLALACWQGGDGARAMIAVDRALADDPDYRLAHLAAESIGSGIPPQSWRDLLRGMPREQCRVPEDPGLPRPAGSV